MVDTSYIQSLQSREVSSAISELDSISLSDSTPASPSFEDVVSGKYAQRRPTNDSLGRLTPTKEEESALGNIARNVAEIPEGAAKGVHDAVMNATAFIKPLSDWLDANVADLSYTMDKPETPTGAVSKSISQFLTGFLPGMKALKAVGMTNKVAVPVIAAAVSDFATRDPHEGRLADIWNQAGLPPNILTDYLASNKDDSVLEARFKNALESAGMGVVSEGVFLGAKAVRSANKVKQARNTEEAHLKAVYGEVSDEDVARIIGDPSKPAIQTKVIAPPKVGGKVEKGMEHAADIAANAMVRKIPKKKAMGGDPNFPKTGLKSEDFETYINFAAIDSPEQVKFVIGKMAEGLKSSVDAARRNTITHEETKKMADKLGMTVTDLLERRKGQPFNAEEALAARQLLTSSGEMVLELAKKAASANAGNLDHFAFRKAMGVHAAIQNEVIGARTETARALNAWKIPAGGSMEKARMIDQVLRTMGGPGESKEMARRLAILAESGASPEAIAKFMQRGWGAKTHDAIKEVWINGLLSSPQTHVVNTLSNTMVTFQQIYERAAAAQLSKLAGGGGVQVGEATAMTFGLMQSFKDAWKMAARSLRTGETGYAFNKIDVTHPNSISAAALGMADQGAASRFVDFLGHTVTMPGRFLGAEDEFFKTIGYRMEVNAQAFRQASSEGLAGADFKKRVAELITSPPEHIRINAADAAMYSTFTGELGKFGTAVMKLRDVDSPLNFLPFILPFVRTPANIARYTFERTPFAPLVGQWRADIAAGGARADLALARMSTGTAMMMLAMDMAANGSVSGQGPTGDDRTVRDALNRSGWKPYSVKVGDRWYSYNRADPFGTIMGLGASIVETIQKGELDDEDVDEWHEVTAMSIAAASQVTINKTYLEGFAKFVELMSEPGRYSEKYVDDLVASFLPGTALMNSIKNMNDPIAREVSSPFEAVQARIIGLSDKLPPRRNLWGEPISAASGLGSIYDAVVPVSSKPEDVAPVDREITRLGKGPSKINKKTSFQGVNISLKKWPEVYDEYVRLAGNGLKSPATGMGAKDYLNAVVSGKHPVSAAYKIMPDEARRDFIVSTISDYRRLAQQQILSDPKFSRFAAEIASIQNTRMQSKVPVLTGE